MKGFHVLLAVALGAAAATAGPAAAQAPPPGCFGLAAKDKVGDHSSTAPGAAQLEAAPGSERHNLDLTETFFTAEGGESAAHFRVAEMSTTVPPGATAISWYLRATVNDADSWLRAMTDFSGLMFYDYGHFVPGVGVGVSEFSVRDGETSGEVYEGANGGLKIVLPPDAWGAPNTAIKPTTWFGYEARQVLPAASPTPVKGGFLYEVDQASGRYTYTVGAACPTEPAAVPEPGGPGGGPPTPAPSDASQRPLPVKVLTKAVKRSRTVKVKLRASERLTQIAAQLKRGKKVFGKGSLGELSGTKTLKLKARKLRKGRYVLDLAGTDGDGARRFLSAKLKVR